MGYVGRVTKLPRGKEFGVIRSNLVEGLDTPFDVAAMKRAGVSGSGSMQVGSSVYFSIRNGKAIGITPNYVRNQEVLYQSTKGRGLRAKGLVHR